MSEKNALEARATAGQQAWKEAVQRLEALTEGLSAKVSLDNLALALHTDRPCHQRTEHARLMKEKAELDRNLAVGEKNLAVRLFCDAELLPETEFNLRRT